MSTKYETRSEVILPALSDCNDGLFEGVDISERGSIHLFPEINISIDLFHTRAAHYVQ
jgi:hypothetical protein